MNDQEKNKQYVILLLFVLMLIAVLFLVLRNSFLTKQINLVKQKAEEAINKIDDPGYIDPIDLVTDPIKGNLKAKNILYVYSSFSCIHCSAYRLELNKLLEKKANEVKVIWKDAVSINDERAKSSAIAARCAQKQGKFWEYHDLLFDNQDDLKQVSYLAFAQELGLDVKKFSTCLESPEILSLIQSGQNEAIAVGVDGTPFTVFNGQKLSGTYAYQTLVDLLSK